MQPGLGYTQEDFSQPEFCRACGTHVPKSYLAMTGGLCANCLRNIQQMQQGMSNPAMPYGGAYRPPRGAFFRSPGFAALLVGLVALVMLGVGGSKYLKLTPGVPAVHRSVGFSDELAKSQGSLVDQPVDDTSVSELQGMAADEINNAFGAGAVNPPDVGIHAVRNKLTDQTTYRADGEFDCVVVKDREHVQWKIDYVRDDQGKWRMIDRQAYYQTDDGVAQFDFDVKKFIHLVH